MTLPNPAENEVTQEEEPIILPAPKRRKIIKCRKCKKELHSDMWESKLQHLALQWYMFA